MAATLNPTVLIDLLSESTSDHDEVEKWYAYKQISTLQQYIQVSQHTIRLDLFTRVDNTNDWLNTFAEQPDQLVTIGGCTLNVSDVYANVVLG